MHVGHFAVGFVAKRFEPKVSLGTFVLASLLADILWGAFLISGIEHVSIKPGIRVMDSLQAYDIAYSHSLLMLLLWGALLATGYFVLRRYRRGAWIIFVAVVSHWVLDVVAHAPDMPLAPGVHRYYGLGLWNSVPATILVEGGCWVIALVVYVRANPPRNRTGIYVFWGVVLFLTLAWYANISGPPPSNPIAMGGSSLIYFSATVAWAYWMNRVRGPVYVSGTPAEAEVGRLAAKDQI
jgi:LexA-binding, inner membrane-associated putative hydrolase